MPSSDTIVATATAPGRSGLGVVRLSGPASLDIIRVLLKDPAYAPPSRKASVRNVYDPTSGQTIDRALVTWFKSPHSFTGEDVVEVSCHGSPVLLRSLIDVIVRLGGRIADPGEFTLRALKNGRLNLSQAEAIRDLINAQTTAAASQAVRQMEGELSGRLQPVKDALLEIIVPLESAVEFVEDDLPDLAYHEIDLKLRDLMERLGSLAATFDAGHLLRDGLKVTIAGRPNVGKSSIFNRLAGKDRAIVTDIPGTTRDTLTELINLDGVPVLVTDTAGIRSSSDAIETLGVERTKRAVADADFTIVVVDGSEPLGIEDHEVIRQVERSGGPHLIALNKSDLGLYEQEIGDGDGTREKSLVVVSAKTGAGLDVLGNAILSRFNAGDSHESGLLITDARHFDLLQRSCVALGKASELLEQRASEELVLVGLYDALRFLGEITGETTPDDVLSRIFATFCIGK